MAMCPVVKRGEGGGSEAAGLRDRSRVLWELGVDHVTQVGDGESPQDQSTLMVRSWAPLLAPTGGLKRGLYVGLSQDSSLPLGYPIPPAHCVLALRHGPLDLHVDV